MRTFVQTKDHSLWLGLADGLVRFDGARFFTFRSGHPPVFPEAAIESLAEGRDGTLYVGTSTGTVFSYKDGRFERLEPLSVGRRPITSLLVSRDGALWIGTPEVSLHRWKDRTDQSFRSFDVIDVQAMVEDPSGTLWFATGGQGIVRHANGEFRRFRSADGLASDDVTALHVDTTGALWAGTTQGLCTLEGDRFRCYGTADGLAIPHVAAVASDAAGDVWVGTAAAGVARFRDGRFEHLTMREGLSDDEVRGLLADREGNLWVATRAGIDRISAPNVLVYGRAEGVADPAIRAVAPGAAGSVWVGTTSGLVVELRGGRVSRRHDLARGGTAPAIEVLHESPDGTLWIVTADARLLRARGSDVAEVARREGEDRVAAILDGPDGPVFHVAGTGLARLEAGRLVAQGTPGLSSGEVYASYADGQGAYWLGGAQGLARWRDGVHTMFSGKEERTVPAVRSVTPDADAAPGDTRLWLATDNGLALLEGERLRRVTVDDGLPVGALRLVLDDRRGFLWLASNAGLYRVAKADVRALLDGSKRPIPFARLDASDGLRSSEIVGRQPGFVAADGRLWIGTANGVVSIDPSAVAFDEPAPVVRISHAAVDGDDHGERRSIRGEAFVEYAPRTLALTRQMRIRHRLEGVDADWIEAGGRASYRNLPPGTYRLQMMASNRYGLWTGAPLVHDIQIREPFVRTAPFYALVAAAALALVLLGLRFRAAQERARVSAVIGERTRIARELHDTLAQGLAGVGIQIDTAARKMDDDPHHAHTHLQLARDMVRSSLAEVRRSIWVLRTQTSKRDRGLLPALADSLAQLTGNTGVEAQMTVNGKARTLEPEVERGLLRIAHEAVTNAVRHAAARTIQVVLSFDRDALRLNIRDDGRGFDPEAPLDRSLGNHFGLVGISERAQAMGGELRLESRPGQGTEIVCRLPYHCRMEDPIDATDARQSEEEGASL